MKNFSEKNGTGIHLLSKRGFTLVEILIVLALIGIVAGLAMSNLGKYLVVEREGSSDLG